MSTYSQADDYRWFCSKDEETLIHILVNVLLLYDPGNILIELLAVSTMYSRTDTICRSNRCSKWLKVFSTYSQNFFSVLQNKKFLNLILLNLCFILYLFIYYFSFHFNLDLFSNVKLPKLKIKRKHFIFSRNKGSYNVTLQHKDANTSFVIPSISSHIIEDNNIPHSSNIMLAKKNNTTIINTNTTTTITEPRKILNITTITSSNSDSMNINSIDDARVGVSLVNNGCDDSYIQKNRQCLDIQVNDTKMSSGIILHIPTKSNNAKRTSYTTTSMSCDMNHEKFTPCIITSCNSSSSTNPLIQQHENPISVHSAASTITVDINANQILLEKNVKRNSIIRKNNNHHQHHHRHRQYNTKIGMSTCMTNNNNANANAIDKIQPPPRHKRKNKVVISCTGTKTTTS